MSFILGFGAAIWIPIPGNVYPKEKTWSYREKIKKIRSNGISWSFNGVAIHVDNIYDVQFDGIVIRSRVLDESCYKVWCRVSFIRYRISVFSIGIF